MPKKRILLVEDSDYWQNVVQDALKNEDVELVVCSNFHDGERAITDGSYDLFVFDNTLGHIRDAAPSLIYSAKARLESVPKIIVFSAGVTPDTERELKEFGAELLIKRSNPEVVRVFILERLS